MRQISLLRLDHRIVRDQRITSHVALTARALGCTEFVYTGERDKNMEESISDVADRWGGQYSVKYSTNPKRKIRDWKGIVVHLTMYGENHTKSIETIQSTESDILVIVGGAKVPYYVYEMADFNTAIGWQPHSEVAATGIFLYSLSGPSQLYHEFDDAKMTIDGTGPKAKRSDRFTD